LIISILGLPGRTPGGSGAGAARGQRPTRRATGETAGLHRV